MSTPFRTITNFAASLRQGKQSCVELVQHFLRGISTLNPTLHAVITTTAEQALQQAEELDAEAKAGRFRSPLHGVPLMNKDLFAMAGVPCTAGSGLFRNRVPESDSNVVARLRAAGGIFLGQANMSEFAATPVGRNKSYGDVRNPWNIQHSPGTSSSGSAVAVAANLCLAATGSDTGNSIRTPASFCGLVGVRPTYGLVGLSGAFPRAPSLDTAGTLTRCVEDAALLLDCLAGYDPADPNSLRLETQPAYADELKLGVEGLRVGIISDFIFKDIHPDTRAAIEQAMRSLRDNGAILVDLERPRVLDSFSPDAMYELICKEFQKVLGPVVAQAAAENYTFDPAIYGDLERAEACTDALYKEIVQARAACIQASGELFESVDALLTPTSSWTAPAYDNAPGSVWREQRRFLAPASFLKLAAVSVPCGFSEGLPLGAHLMGPALSESRLFRLAACIESGTEQRTPPVYWE